MTSQRPCWCSKTKKWQPWWCTKLILRELNSIFKQILSFVSENQYGCWSREWKCSADLFHNGGQIKYSFILMLITLSSLATTSKFQENICFKMRAVGLTNINTYMLFTGREVRIGKNCARGLEYGPRPAGLYSRQRAQFFPIRTDQGRWITFLFISKFYF